MTSGKSKQFSRPPKKAKPKTAAPETVDDFQEAADFEESAGGKHRAGDPVKSGRAFVRALDVYDHGLQKHPRSFDLAYNKARLQLEMSQQPVLLKHVGVALVEWLQLTLESHRYALRLDEDNPEVLFNSAQALTSLAEQLSENGKAPEAVPLLQEALELLSSCLSRQEMLLEQHVLDFPDVEEGGVPLDSETSSEPPSDVEMSEQSATIETPVTANDLIDTVHASLSALTTLVPLSEHGGLQTIGDMAHCLTEQKAPKYVSLLPTEEQEKAQLAVGLDRAIFVAAFANAQFDFQMIELETFLQRLDSFNLRGKDILAGALSSEAEARKELVLSVIDRFNDASPDFPATLCWTQLGQAQDLYSKVTKLTDEDAQDHRAEVYKSKGDIELLRYRLASMSHVNLSDGIRRSASTLVQNAQTFYKGAVEHAKINDDDDLGIVAQQRWDLATSIAALIYGGDSERKVVDIATVESCVEEGLVALSLAQSLFKWSAGEGGL